MIRQFFKFQTTLNQSPSYVVSTVKWKWRWTAFSLNFFGYFEPLDILLPTMIFNMIFLYRSLICFIKIMFILLSSKIFLLNIAWMWNVPLSALLYILTSCRFVSQCLVMYWGYQIISDILSLKKYYSCSSPFRS